MKKSFIAWCVFVFYIFTVVSGLGWGFYSKAWNLILYVVILGILAFPTFKGACKALFGKDA